MKGPFSALILASLALATPAIAADAPLLHVMFQDHAVLQRDRPIPVYGQAAPNTTVTVKLGTSTATTKADKTGQWRTTLAALLSGGPYTLEARSGTTTQSVQDVLVGDVFLCTGQSNMQRSRCVRRAMRRSRCAARPTARSASSASPPGTA